jgi:predicted negative regulator of RcsB-dependent stress response
MYDLEEQEKVDLIKAWWKHNRYIVLIAMALLVVVVLGAQWWKQHQRSLTQQAATAFREFEQALQAHDMDKAYGLSARFMKDYASTPYAAKSALVSAYYAHQAGDAAGTKTQLGWVVENAREPGLKDVARLRLSGVLLDEKKYDEAAKLVEKPDDESFVGLYADRKGDIKLSQGQQAEARAQYRIALDKLGGESEYGKLVRLKLDALGSTP